MSLHSKSEKLRVLYIAGWGRSGTTLLSRMLGQIDGFFSVGETTDIWQDSFVEDRPCDCGEPFSSCAVWRRVLQDGLSSAIDPLQMSRLRERVRTRYLPSMMLPGWDRLWRVLVRPYLDGLDEFYRAVQETTGCRVILDASKNPVYGRLLELLPSLDLRVVHLVRDPRAAAYSWQRTKLERRGPDPIYMPRYSPFKSSLLWTTWNLAIEALWNRGPDRYVRLRYEDLVDRPRESLQRVLHLTGEPVELSFLKGSQVRLDTTHGALGNPNRFRTGTITLRLDDEWRHEIGTRDKLTATGLTFPLLKRYGYPIASSPGRRIQSE
jgi:hypothetical protein